MRISIWVLKTDRWKPAYINELTSIFYNVKSDLENNTSKISETCSGFRIGYNIIYLMMFLYIYLYIIILCTNEVNKSGFRFCISYIGIIG